MTVHELENLLSEYPSNTPVSVWDTDCCFHESPVITEFKNETNDKVLEILLEPERK
jgi:hypothetical protein